MYQQKASRRAEGVKFTKKERDHKGGLKRTHPAARLFDADKSVANLNDIAVLQRGNSRDIKERNIDRADRAHQILDDNLLDPHRPGNSDKEKTNRESEMAEPW